ncbi:MAG: ATP-binding protein [Phycisphaerales bacterium]
MTAPHPPKSIRRTLAAWLLIGLAIVIAISGSALYLGIRSAYTRQFDDTLGARSAALAASTRWDGTHLDLDFTPESMPWYNPGPHAEYFEIRATGTSKATLFQSPSMKSQTWSAARAGQSAQDAPLPDGRRGRVLDLTFRPLPEEELDGPSHAKERKLAEETAPTLTLAVGMGREDLDSKLHLLALWLALAGIAITVGAVLIVLAALKRGLEPLDHLSTQMRVIKAETLATPLETSAAPRELIPVYSRLNDLLGRLHGAFEREKRFTGAAAHELRTPIAELRSLIEVSRSRERTIPEMQSALDEALAITKQMDHRVQGLFALVRSEAAQSATLADVDICTAARRSIQSNQSRAAAKGGGITLSAPDSLLVRADTTLLEITIENIIDNAVEYASPTPAIVCTLVAQSDGTVSFEVTNAIDSSVAQNLDHFFEPLWRRSESRTDKNHLGLGLPLARQAAQAMGGDLRAAMQDGEMIALRLTLNKANALNQAQK